jgi:hypothetical protein
MIGRWVDEGITRGEIRKDVDREIVPALLGVLRFIPQHLGLVTAGGFVSGDRVLNAVVDLFEAGLSAEPLRPAAGHHESNRSRGQPRRPKKALRAERDPDKLRNGRGSDTT